MWEATALQAVLRGYGLRRRLARARDHWLTISGEITAESLAELAGIIPSVELEELDVETNVLFNQPPGMRALSKTRLEKPAIDPDAKADSNQIKTEIAGFHMEKEECDSDTVVDSESLSDTLCDSDSLSDTMSDCGESATLREFCIGISDDASDAATIVDGESCSATLLESQVTEQSESCATTDVDGEEECCTTTVIEENGESRATTALDCIEEPEMHIPLQRINAYSTKTSPGFQYNTLVAQSGVQTMPAGTLDDLVYEPIEYNPDDRASLLKAKRRLEVEILWLQQAIESRQNVSGS